MSWPADGIGASLWPSTVALCEGISGRQSSNIERRTEDSDRFSRRVAAGEYSADGYWLLTYAVARSEDDYIMPRAVSLGNGRKYEKTVAKDRGKRIS